MRSLVRPAAAAEIEAAADWYEGKRRGLGRDFLQAVDQALDSIRSRPDAYPVVHRGTRRALLRRFPYAVYFRIPGCRSHRRLHAWPARSAAMEGSDVTVGRTIPGYDPGAIPQWHKTAPLPATLHSPRLAFAGAGTTSRAERHRPCVVTKASPGRSRGFAGACPTTSRQSSARPGSRLGCRPGPELSPGTYAGPWQGPSSSPGWCRPRRRRCPSCTRTCCSARKR